MSTKRFVLKIGACIAAVMACQLMTSASHADAIYDNVNNSLANYQSVSANGPLGASFAITQSYSITDIKLQLMAEDNTDGGSFMVFIANQSAGAPDLNPGDALASTTITDSSFASSFTPTVVDWSLSSPAALSAGSYWVVVANSSGTSVDWWQEGDDSGTGVAGQNFYVATNSPSVIPNSNGAMLMTVTGQSGVPEPAGIAVIGSALVGLALVRRRISKSA